MLTLCVKSPSQIFGPISGFNGGRESFHWHSVVVEFVVTHSLGVALEIGVSMSVSGISGRHFQSSLPHLLTRH